MVVHTWVISLFWYIWPVLPFIVLLIMCGFKFFVFIVTFFVCGPQEDDAPIGRLGVGDRAKNITNLLKGDRNQKFKLRYFLLTLNRLETGYEWIWMSCGNHNGNYGTWIRSGHSEHSTCASQDREGSYLSEFYAVTKNNQISCILL